MLRWKRQKRFMNKGTASRAQGMVELAVILPALVLALFVIIELGRLFHAWLAVENGARFGIRYAVTTDYDPENCAGGATAGGVCINPADELSARVTTIHEVAWSGSSSIMRKAEGEVANTVPGYFNVVVCKPEDLIPPASTFDSYSCQPTEDPGALKYHGCKLAAPLFSGTVGVDATSSGRYSGDISRSHTTGTGENRLMLVGISVSNWPNTPSVSSATYGGQTLTLLGSAFVDGEGVLIYYLLNPNSGTANVVIDYSSDPSYGSVVGVMTFTGVDQTTPLGPFASATGTGSSASVSVSSAPDELVFDSVMNAYDKSIWAGTNQTTRWNNKGEPTGGGSTEAGASSVTMSWSWSWSNPWAIGAVSIKPATEPTSTPTPSTTPTPTDTPEGTATATPTPSITPTATHTQIPTSTSTPTPTPMTGSDLPDFPACPTGFALIGTYADYVRRDIEPKSHSYPFDLSVGGDVILSGWVMEGHPDLGCPGHPDCDELQHHEDIIFEIDGIILGIYEDEEHGPHENAFYFFGPMVIDRLAGSHTLTFRHTLDGEDAESVGFRYSLCGPMEPSPTPTLTLTATPSSTHTPTNTPIQPTATASPIPTNTPASPPGPSMENPGEPGERVVVVTEFNHPLIMPILSSIWPQLRLTSMREAIVETYFKPPAVDTPQPFQSPTPRPTNTPGPTNSPAPTNTPVPTSTASAPENVALNKPATASYKDGFPPGNAVDGSDSSKWKSQNLQGGIEVDLGSVYAISKIVLKWSQNAGMDYDVQVSNDDVNWTTVASVSGNTQNDRTDTHDNLNTSGRYVRIANVVPVLNYGVHLWEFEVWSGGSGTPGPTSTPGGPTDPPPPPPD